MLGGSFWVAVLRNAMSMGLMMSFFLMLDRPRYVMKKTIGYYVVFGSLAVTGYSLWYLAAAESFVKYASLSSIVVTGLFCELMSSGRVYLSLYKMAVAFYLLSVCVFCGVDVARWWFGGNVWVDILVRFFCVVIVLGFTWIKLRRLFLDGVDFLVEEMDLFSAVTLLVSVMIGAVVAYWPNLQGFSIFNMVRAFVTLFMVGVLQYTILHLYIHLGQEHYYQREKELLEVNEQLLYQQMEIMRESEKEAARIRHDVRHHTLLIKEYASKGEIEELLGYLEQYDEDIENQKIKYISRNRAVNSILSVYARKARSRNIQVHMDVKVGEHLAVRDIDWIAILANAFENAIHGCTSSGASHQEINIYIAQKGNKIVIRFSNTSAENVNFHKGLPKSKKGAGLGVPSIIKTASRYDGETDFEVQKGEFTTRILLNIPCCGEVYS